MPARLLRHGLACTLLALVAMARAGPWEAHNAQGLTLRIVQDVARTRDAYVLERRYPDGTLDTGFGQQGSVLFQLGPDNEGPAALRVDTMGRAWVAGASAGSGGTLQAVVLRLLASGAEDSSFGTGGRSATAPAGQRARALDLAPLADGSAYVAGLVTDAQGQERSGWWRLRPDGRVDPGFGLGGLWIDNGTGSTEAVDMATAPDGSVALGLRRGDGTRQQLESWVLSPGASAPRLVAVVADEPGARLQWRDARWQWLQGGRTLAAAVATTVPPPAVPAAAAGPARPPLPLAASAAPSAVAAEPPPAPGWPGPVLAAAAGCCVLVLSGGWWLWRITRRPRA